jgi:hypothetical protein
MHFLSGSLLFLHVSYFWKTRPSESSGPIYQDFFSYEIMERLIRNRAPLHFLSIEATTRVPQSDRHRVKT